MLYSDQSKVDCYLAPFLRSLLKKGVEEIRRKSCHFWRLALVVPIRLQNKTMCTHDTLSTQQKKNCRFENELKARTCYAVPGFCVQTVLILNIVLIARWRWTA